MELMHRPNAQRTLPPHRVSGMIQVDFTAKKQRQRMIYNPVVSSLVDLFLSLSCFSGFSPLEQLIVVL